MNNVAAEMEHLHKLAIMWNLINIQAFEASSANPISCSLEVIRT